MQDLENKNNLKLYQEMNQILNKNQILKSKHLSITRFLDIHEYGFTSSSDVANKPY